jgi:hypothetical protein
MQAAVSSNPLDQYCLDKLQKLLDLAMHTAEAASTENNHKVVIQAVREVTRIVTLITKIDNSSAPKAAAEITAAPVPARKPANEVQAEVAEVKELTNGLVQDVLKFFPGLTSDPKTVKPGVETNNQLFWQRNKGGKSRKSCC